MKKFIYLKREVHYLISFTLSNGGIVDDDDDIT